MNWLVFIAGLFALFATAGHFTIGIKNFLRPMMDASFDQVPKKVMQSVFHYVSVFQVLSAVTLLSVGIGFSFGLNSTLLVWFIALNYSLFAVTQLYIALTSGIPNGASKLFQWVFWVIIAVLAWVGA
jgi:hypothetical protein